MTKKIDSSYFRIFTTFIHTNSEEMNLLRCISNSHDEKKGGTRSQKRTSKLSTGVMNLGVLTEINEQKKRIQNKRVNEKYTI